MGLENALQQAFNLITFPDEALITSCDLCTELDLALIKTAHKPMFHIMKAYGGLGLAANQVGISKRFFVLKTNSTAPGPGKVEDTVVIINPVVLDISEEVCTELEGCLSLPLFSENITRPNEITLQFKNENWEDTTAVFSGTEARCIQHELSHLNGRLVLDELSLMKQDMYKKKLYKNRKHGKIDL